MAWLRKVGATIDGFLNPEQQATLERTLGIRDKDPPTLCGLHEPLDKAGYKRVLRLKDHASVASFLERLLASQGLPSHEEDIQALAHCCLKEKTSFGELLLLLGKASTNQADCLGCNLCVCVFVVSAAAL
eukprot:TRINITY_DN23538_c0_g1_i2.p1 TRINITY_DN23538_c0_g1~~TRINITY_DN23538_c0_g1_i2.p1  ORF type:complete len:144 (-),score=24.06 TRINITY_DN23538_c0_g1_i2:72-461(-)